VREVEQSLALDRPDIGPASRGSVDNVCGASAGRARRHGNRRRIPRRRSGLAPSAGRRGRTMPPARPSWFQWPLLEAAIENNIVADFPLCNKSVQLFLFGPRPLRTAKMRKLLFESLFRRPFTEKAPSPDDAAVTELATPPSVTLRVAGSAAVCRYARSMLALQWMRARNPRLEQCLLRCRALRPPLRGLAAPCRCIDGDRARDQEHARGAGAYLSCDAQSQMGGRDRRLRPRRRVLRRQLRGVWRGFRGDPGRSPHISCPPTPTAMLQGLLALLERVDASAVTT